MKRLKKNYSFLYMIGNKNSSRINNKGLTSIYFRLTVNGKRKEISTKKEIRPDEWNQSKQCVKGNTEHIRRINHYLNSLKNDMEDAYNLLIKEKRENLTPNEVMEQAIPGQTNNEYTILKLFKKHNDEMAQLVGHSYSINTFERYKSSYKRLTEFLKTEYRKDDMSITNIDNAFGARYNTHLITTYECTPNTSVKYIKHLKKVLNFGVTMNWIKYNPINIKIKINPFERGYLTEEELEAIMNLSLNVDYTSMVRDIFVFCCHTGLSYSDVFKLTKDFITIGINGMKSIVIDRSKTKIQSIIPLLPPALEILHKYKEHESTNENGYLLPVPTNQDLNRCLKVLAKSCGITKNLSMHIARHTFATTVTLNRGVPIETVSKMLGHTSIRTTQIYSKIVAAKVYNDMMILQNKYYNNNTKEIKPALVMSK